MTHADVALLNESFGNLADTLMRRRMMEQENQRYQQQQGIEQQRYGQQEADRQVQLDLERQRLEAQAKNYQSEDEARKAAAKSKDTVDTAKASKTYYFISPSTKNTVSFVGTPTEAQAKLEQFQQQKPEEQFQVTDKEPDSLKDLEDVKIDDNTHLHVTAAEALKYYQHKQDLAQKAQNPKGVAPHQEIRQVLNPAHVVGGVVDTNTPPYLSLTNTITPLNIGDSGMPNLAPQQAQQSSSIPPAAIKALQQNPDKWQEFEQKFGSGSSSQYLP